MLAFFRPCNFNFVTGTGESKGGCVNHPSLSTHPPKWNKRPFTHFSINSPPHYRGKSHPGAQISQQSFTRGKPRGWSTCKPFQNLKTQDGSGKVREIHDTRNLPDGFSFDPAQGFKLDDPQHEVSQSATLQPINHLWTNYSTNLQEFPPRFILATIDAHSPLRSGQRLDWISILKNRNEIWWTID